MLSEAPGLPHMTLPLGSPVGPPNTRHPRPPSEAAAGRGADPEAGAHAGRRTWRQGADEEAGSRRGGVAEKTPKNVKTVMWVPGGSSRIPSLLEHTTGSLGEATYNE